MNNFKMQTIMKTINTIKNFAMRFVAVLTLVLMVGNIWGTDYEKLTPGTDALSNGDEVLIAIEDRKAGTFYFIQCGSTKHLAQTVTNGVVSNPEAATVWIATASSTNWTFRKKGATSNGYLYNSNSSSATLATDNSSSATWTVSNGSSGSPAYKYFKINVSNGRYICWNASSTFGAFASSNWTNNGVQAANANLAQGNGALQIFRKVSGYAVTYNNGGHGTAPSNTSATSVTLSAITGVTGYTCTGWVANKNVKQGNTTITAGTALSNSTTYTILDATQFTAQWSTNTTTVSFNQNSGTGGQTSSVTATYGSAMPTPITVPTRDHYIFEGYYDGTGNTATQYYTNTGASAKNWNKDVATATLYAKWTEKGIARYVTNCCTPLASISGSASWNSPTEVVLKWNKLGSQVTSWGNVTYGVSGSVACDVDPEDDTKMKCTISGLACGTEHTFTLHPTLETGVCALAADPTIVSTSPKYNVAYSLSGVALASGEGIQEEGESVLCGDFLAMYEPASGAFALPNAITVKIGEATLDPSNYTWYTSDGTLMIDAQYITDHVTVAITGQSVGCDAPAVLGTPTLTSITDGVITVNCPSISAGTSCAINDYGFIWKKDDAPESLSDNQNQVGTNDQSAAFSKAINIAFETGTTYNFKAYGTNGKGTYYSSNLAVKPQSVTFDSKGGSEVATVYVNYNTAVAQPADPTKLGYDFAGWKLGEDPYTFSTPVIGNITLDAAWTNHNYTIMKTLSNCTSNLPATHTYGNAFSYTITADDKYVLPATITISMGDDALTVNTDYTWDNSNGALVITKEITGDLAITVTAQRVYSVTLKDKNVVLTQENAGANVTLPSRKSCEGYAFQGWSTTYNATWNETQPTIIPAGEYGASLSSDIDLYPVYKGTVQENRFSSYTKVTEDQSDWSGKYLLSTGTYTATGAVASHHLSRDNSGIPETSTTSREFTLAKVGTVGYSLLIPDGSLYIGYGSSTAFTEDDDAPTTNDKSYLWTPSTSGLTNCGTTDRIIRDGGSDFRPYSSGNTAVFLYKRIETLQNVDKYISVSGCCVDLDYIQGSVTTVTQTSATLQWNKLSHVESNPYSLSYKVHGSSDEPTAFEGEIDLSGAKATCTVTDLACGTEYDFILHIDAVSGYCDTDSTMVGTTGKYAVTKADATNGSFTTSVEEACEGTSITLSATPASEWYEFTRWTIQKTSDHSDITTEVSLGSVGNASTSFTMPAFGVTVIATFDVKKAKYDITLNANDGQSAGAGTITEGSNLMSIVTTPSRTGYTIAGYYTLAEGGYMVADATGTLQAGVDGWTDGDGKFTKNDNGTLYTHWSVQSFTLEWNTNGGSDLAGDPTTGIVAYGTALTLPTQPTKTGYHFVKWNSSQDGDGIDYNGSMPAANTTYYAQWEIDTYTVTWLNNGNIYAPETAGTSSAQYNTTISTIPSPNPSVAPTQCSDKVFMGWTKVEIDGVSETNPGNIFTTAQGAPKITENTTFHAVWADRVGGTYELVTSTSTALANGDKIIIVNSGAEGDALAIGKQNKNNRSDEEVSIDDNLKIEPELAETTDDNKVYQFELVTNGTYFNIKDVVAINKYLCASGGTSSNDLTLSNTPSSNNTKFTISVNETGIATITANLSESGAKNKLRHNSTSHLFSCYGSGQADVYIYRELTSYENYITACCKDKPVVGAASSSNVGATTATVICAAGATIGSKGCSIEEYGFVVGTTSNPTIGGSGVTKYALPLEDFVAEASFSKGLSNLSGTYYVRPFATNALGTTYGTQTSFETAVVTSISVKEGHGATQTKYVNGESFNGAGLIIIEHLNNDTENEVTYDGHEGSFSFSPSPLTTGTTSVTISCSGQTTSQAVTVYAVNDIVIKDENLDEELSGEGKPTASRSGATLSTSAGTEKYVFKEWLVTNASIENNKIVNPTGEVSITAVYWKPRVVTWLNNNVEYSTTTVAYNTKPAFPGTPSSDDATSITFAGWSNGTWVGKKALNEVTATIYASANEMQEMTAETATYHAVFMKAETGYIKVNSLSDIEAGQYVIVNNGKGLPTATTGATNSPSATTNVTVQNDKVTSSTTGLVWTFTGTYSAMTITSGTNYLYNLSSSTGVRVGDPGNNATAWAFETNSTGFALKNNGRYCATYPSGSDWRSYTDKDQSNYGDGGKVYLYKYVDNKSDYMTTKTYTVTCQVAANSDGYGTVSPTSVTNVLKGTSLSVTDNVLNIGETAVTATPTAQSAQYDYTFSGWSWAPSGATVGNSDVTATASFTRTVRNYDITATLTNVTADVAFPANRDYGSSFNCTISVGANYMLPSTIEVEGAEYEWNVTTGALNIASIVGPVSITISGVPSYSLIFKNSNETVVKEIKVADGTTDFGYTIVETPTVTPEGYEFLNQWTDETSTYNVGEEIHISAEKTLYPVWKVTTTTQDDVIDFDGLPASVVEIIVTDGKDLNINEPDRTIDNLTVEAGGKVSGSEALTVNDLTIKTSLGTISGTDSNTSGKSGEISNSNITANGDVWIEIELTQESEASYGWYAFSVPFKVDAMHGVYGKPDGEDWQELQNEVGYAIMKYHGDVRAQGLYGWKKYRDIMEPGTLYIIAVGKTEYKTLRFKKVANADIVKENQDKVQVYEYALNGGSDGDQGWNGIGNPNLQVSHLSGDLQFLDHENNRFILRDGDNTKLLVGTAFMMQRDATETITINTGAGSGSIALAPAREPRGVETTTFKVYLTDEATGKGEDNIFLRTSEDATNNYEVGHDLAKMSMGDAKCAQMWVPAYGTQLCAAYFPLINDKAEYPLSINTPKAGTYSISTQENENATIYLTYNGRAIWNLSMSACELDLTKGLNEGYGLRLVVNAPAVVTGVDQIDAKAGAQKVIIDEHVYILRGGQMYDVNGKMVK